VPTEEFTVSLRVFHPASSHEEIAMELGLKADFGYTVGQPRRTPAGRPLEGTNKNTFCSFTLLPKQPGDFVEGVRQLFSHLQSRRDFLRHVVEGGGRSELFIGIFAEESAGFTLRTADMLQLADLSLELSVEMYI
jgi:hypothetical protein